MKSKLKGSHYIGSSLSMIAIEINFLYVISFISCDKPAFAVSIYHIGASW